MLVVFEDAFMDAQSRTVSLCMELLESSDIQADKIYIYMFQNEFQDFYNAFFKIGNEMFRLNDLFSDEQIDEFFDNGIEDIESIIEVCKNHERKCPNEFRLTYNVMTKAFESKYEYDDFVSDESESLIDRFECWFNEVNLI